MLFFPLVVLALVSTTYGRLGEPQLPSDETEFEVEEYIPLNATDFEFIKSATLVKAADKRPAPSSPLCTYLNRFKACTAFPREGEFFYPIIPNNAMSIEYTYYPVIVSKTACSFPRVKSASATISKYHNFKGGNPTNCARDWSKMLNALDKNRCPADAGHILAKNLGGKGYVANIFPQAPSINSGEYKTFELEIAGCLPLVERAELSWSLTYDDDHFARPSWIDYTVKYVGSTSRNCLDKTEKFPNFVSPQDLPNNPYSIASNSYCQIQYEVFQGGSCRSQAPKLGTNSYSLAGGGTMTVTYEEVLVTKSRSTCKILRVKSASATITRSNLVTKDSTVKRSDNSCGKDWTSKLNLLDAGLAPNNNPGCNTHAGHILAHSLGGPESMWNMFPQDPSMNTGHFYGLEDRIASCVSMFGGEAKLNWVFDYTGHYTRPFQVTYTVEYTKQVGFDPNKNKNCKSQTDGRTYPNFVPIEFI